MKNSENILNDLLTEAKKQKACVSDDVRASLSEKLADVAVEKEKRAFFKLRSGTVIATAASLLILLSVFMVYENFTEKNTRKLYYESTVSQGSPVTIKLVYNAVKDLEDVKFHIELAGGLTFHSNNSEIEKIRSHNWSGKLEKGENIIPFVVRTSGKGKFRIKAHAKYEKFRHNQEIVLESGDSQIKVSMFRLPSVAL